jgi:MoxR-like ATPase
MSDVAAIQNLVQKRNQLKNEIAKVIVGQDAVVDQILICIFQVDMLYWLVFLDWLKHY